MKAQKIILLAFFTLMFAPLFAQQKQQSDTIAVAGECGMCKNRIQKTLKMDGITTAVWDTESKLLSVTYDPSVISNDEIQKKIAAVGHDTPKYTAPDDVYNKLPGCCKYDRKKE